MLQDTWLLKRSGHEIDKVEIQRFTKDCNGYLFYLNHYESSVAFDVVNIHVREDKKCN